MTTIEPSVQGDVISPKIGQRILEIMEERGKAFTQQAIATRIGMNRVTLSKKLRGERDLYLFELRRIAEALNVSTERIMLEDTRDPQQKLESYLSKVEELDTALEIAKKISDAALGITERSKAFNDLGRAYFLLRQYQDAHESWTFALQCARNVYEKYNDPMLYHTVLANLLLSSTMVENYTNVESALAEIELVFDQEPTKLGIVYYTRAKIAEANNDYQSGKIEAYNSLECYLKTQNQRMIGKAQATVAHYEYLLSNYLVAKELLEQACKNLEPFPLNHLYALKDYAKCLIKLGEQQKAANTIRFTLEKHKHHHMDFHDILSRLYILLSVATEEREHAESVLVDTLTNEQVRHFAYRFLKQECIRSGDEALLMKYTVIDDTLGISKNNIFDEEVF